MSKDRFLSNWESQTRKGVLELVVMAALAEREMYGYQLVELIKSERGLKINDGTLYTILARLRAEKFIRHRWEHMNNGPARKYYTLTDAGRTTLEDMRQTWNEIVGAVARSENAGGREGES